MNEAKFVTLFITIVFLLLAGRTVFSAVKNPDKSGGGYMVGVSTMDEQEGTRTQNVSENERVFQTPTMIRLTDTLPAVPEKNSVTPAYSQVNAEQEMADKKESALQIDALHREVRLRNRKITILEEKITQLEKQLEDREANLYVLQSQQEQGQTSRKNLYEVKKGDSLWKIAGKKEVYGNHYKWITIYNANMEKIKHPNVIYAGQLFDIQ
jgi:nucleoid-associated protein YgaU